MNELPLLPTILIIASALIVVIAFCAFLSRKGKHKEQDTATTIVFVISTVFGVLGYLAPIAGVVFYATKLYIGLYICTAYCLLFALQRMPMGDCVPIIGMVISALFAIPMHSLFKAPYLPVAAMFICVDDGYNAIKSVIALRSAMRQNKRMKKLSDLYDKDDTQ